MTRRDAIKLAIAGALSPLLSFVGGQDFEECVAGLHDFVDYKGDLYWVTYVDGETAFICDEPWMITRRPSPSVDFAVVQRFARGGKVKLENILHRRVPLADLMVASRWDG